MANAEEWSKENGKEKLWFAENPITKRIYFTSPVSPIQVGFVLKSTTNPKEMDRLFNRMHDQERERNQILIEGIYNRGREHYDRLRSALRTRLNSSGVSDGEKNVIRASLALMDEKDTAMQQNTTYGVSAMQESSEPLEGPRTRIM